MIKAAIYYMLPTHCRTQTFSFCCLHMEKECFTVSVTLHLTREAIPSKTKEF